MKRLEPVEWLGGILLLLWAFFGAVRPTALVVDQFLRWGLGRKMALVVCIPVWALLGPGVSCLVYKIATEIRDHLNYKRSNWESSVQRQESFTQRDKVLRFFYRSLDYVYAIAEAIAVVVFIGILAGWIPVGIFSFFKSVFSFLFKR